MSIHYTLESALSLSALPRSNLWLVVPPTPTINPEVWTLVCLAAISAMDYGRARLWSAPSDFSSSNCIAHFWHTLQSFASSSQHFHWTLPATHPFLCTIDGILQVNAPLPPPDLGFLECSSWGLPCWTLSYSSSSSSLQKPDPLLSSTRLFTPLLIPYV
jgi:hypothetical protein